MTCAVHTVWIIHAQGKCMMSRTCKKTWFPRDYWNAGGCSCDSDYFHILHFRMQPPERIFRSSLLWSVLCTCWRPECWGPTASLSAWAKALPRGRLDGRFQWCFTQAHRLGSLTNSKSRCFCRKFCVEGQAEFVRVCIRGRRGWPNQCPSTWHRTVSSLLTSDSEKKSQNENGTVRPAKLSIASSELWKVKLVQSLHRPQQWVNIGL